MKTVGVVLLLFVALVGLALGMCILPCEDSIEFVTVDNAFEPAELPAIGGEWIAPGMNAYSPGDPVDATERTSYLHEAHYSMARNHRNDRTVTPGICRAPATNQIRGTLTGRFAGACA